MSGYRLIMKPGWYYRVFYEQAGYGPEFGDENPDDVGPFNTKQEAEDDSFDWSSPFGVEDPYYQEGYIEIIKDKKFVRLPYKEQEI